ncbi:hypothetical protein G6F31_021543 [Rhizopus arrhizus]|nr:hypothetical protein G6F31_021543 [Rhizopus arrhizus]
MVTPISAAAPKAAMAAPPLPELSSATARMPIWRSHDSMTDAPRSLKLQVGLNHSSLKWGRRPPQARSTIGVAPSPRETGLAMSCGKAAR